MKPLNSQYHLNDYSHLQSIIPCLGGGSQYEGRFIEPMLIIKGGFIKYGGDEGRFDI